MTATAGIILIGDELLSGKVVDENAQLLIGELRDLGVSLRRIIVIPDVLDEIAATVRDFAARFDHVFTSGGVGPTHDDLTMDGVARAFETGVERHPELERQLREFYLAKYGKVEERNLRMAEVPKGATLVAGDPPSWPVIAMRNVYILPGVPQIFRRKFLSIKERFRQAPFFLRSVFTKRDEGGIAAHLDDIVARFKVQVGSYPRFDDGTVALEYKVKVTIESKDEREVEAATAELARLLGEGGVVRIA